MKKTKLYLNTWRAYNDGGLGYGWMTAQQARGFIEANPEKDGGEWFIADIDNYIGVHFDSLEYCDVFEVVETIEALEAMTEYERAEIVALMEYLNTESAQVAIDKKSRYIFYADIDAYHDSCDEIVEIEASKNSILARYFDFSAYHRDCDFDIMEMSNGVCIRIC